MKTLSKMLPFFLVFMLNKVHPQQFSLFSESKDENMVSAKIYPSLPGTDSTLLLLPPCSPSAANDDCASAVTLAVGAAALDGTLCNSATQAGEPNAICGTTIGSSVWYSFQATAAEMYVDVNQLSGMCYLTVAVYGGYATSTSGCIPSASQQIACFGATAPIEKALRLTGLIVSGWYMVQVGYISGGLCGNNANATFTIHANTPQNCSACSSPCGPVKGYTIAPSSYQQLRDDGACYPMRVPNDTVQKCFIFTSWDDSVSLNAGWFATGGCGGFTTVQFSLYGNSCTSVTTSANGNFTGLTIGNDYTICYYLVMSTSCNTDTLCPYYRQTNIAPLPVELLDFTAVTDEEKIICKWLTATEINNDYFTIERAAPLNPPEGGNIGSASSEIPPSGGGGAWQVIGTIKGAGNSSTIRKYEFVDELPSPEGEGLGVRYYRLKQTDFNGQFSFSKTVSVNYDGKYSMNIFPNPFSSSINVAFGREVKDKMNIDIEDIFGRTIFSNTIALEIPDTSMEFDFSFLREGIYLVRFINGTALLRYKIIKS